MSNPAASFQTPISAAPGILIRGATLGYENRHLFERLDFDVAAGRCTCLLGPSGVGKSSLLRLIAGLTSSQEGDIRCDDGAPLTGRYAFMAQQDLLMPWLSVIGNVTLGFALRKTVPPLGKAQSLLAELGLADAAAMMPSALSGGMRQRAALARTLIEDRPVILMDEPFSALDAVTRFRLQNLAAEKLAGRTVLLVTHDPLEALRLGHRIFVLSGSPACLSAPIEPKGITPRDPADPDLLRLQGELLRTLAAEAA